MFIQQRKYMSFYGNKWHNHTYTLLIIQTIAIGYRRAVTSNDHVSSLKNKVCLYSKSHAHPMLQQVLIIMSENSYCETEE